MESVDAAYDRLCDFLKAGNKVEEISTMFSSIEHDNFRVSLATELLRLYDILKFPVCSQEPQKSVIKATEYRKLGNHAYQQKDDRKALQFYNKSIAASPIAEENNLPSTHDLSLGFANRSAVMFSLGDDSSCLTDIGLALKYSYPVDLRYKLFERKGRCLLRLKRFDEAYETLTDSLKALELSSLSSEKYQKVERQITTLQQKAKDRAIEAENRYKFCWHQTLPNKTYRESNEIVCGSDAIDIKYNAQMGRYIQASKDLTPGDVIAVETPFASVLLEEGYYTHCYNCLLRCNTLIPCKTCAMVMFCGDDCQNEALLKSHSIDCSLLPLLSAIKVDKMGMLALRIVLVASDYGKNLNDMIAAVKSFETDTSTDNRTKGFNKNGKYSSDEYSTIYHLVGNTDKRTIGDLFKRAVTVSCILHCIEKHSTFFGNQSYVDEKEVCIGGDIAKSKEHESIKASVEETRLIVGGILMRHLQNLPCNAHEVSEFIHTNSVEKNEGKFDLDMIEIGAAAYSFLSLLNHSCDPNVVRNSHCGSTAVLRVIKPIRKGEQVFDNYGYHYATHSIQERQCHLSSQYFFNCSCEACSNSWPLYVSLPCDKLQFKCTHCGVTLEGNTPTELYVGNTCMCTSCKHVNDLGKTRKLLVESSDQFRDKISLVLSGYTEGIAGDLIKHLCLLDKYVQRPWKEYNDCQEALKQCFNFLGNCYTI